MEELKMLILIMEIIGIFVLIHLIMKEYDKRIDRKCGIKPYRICRGCGQRKNNKDMHTLAFCTDCSGKEIETNLGGLYQELSQNEEKVVRTQ